LEFMSSAPAIFTNEVITEREEGYLLPIFYPGKEEDIVFLHRSTDLVWKIVRLELPTQAEDILLDSQEQIWAFDLNAAEALLWVAEPGDLFMRQPGQAAVPIAFSSPIADAKWTDQGILVETQGAEIHLIDTAGNPLAQLLPPVGTRWEEGNARLKWNVSGNFFMRLHIHPGREERWLLTYQLPDFQPVDTLFLDSYPNVDENSLLVTIGGLWFDFVYPDRVILSRTNRMYDIDLASHLGSVVWEREACLVTEEGLALSASGERVISGCSQLTQSPYRDRQAQGEKERGLMLLKDGFTTLTTSYP
jgi:hypothetical protein